MNSLIPSLNIKIESPEILIEHRDKLMLIGSCFSEHMGKRLNDAKFQVLENPNGILFNPLSVCHSIGQYIENSNLDLEKMYYQNEVWHHWDFHSRYSNSDRTIALKTMQASINQAHVFLKDADWLMITLGSAYQYFLKSDAYFVANCHRAPGQNFDKRLLTIEAIQEALHKTIQTLRLFNPKIKFIFTISPVRHYRDGIVENNRSKARLIEAVHEILEQQGHCYYFPAYELLIDVLRDYRFYDSDLVHPNFAATQIVWDQFSENFFSENAKNISEKMRAITTAFNHKVQFPETENYKKFKYDFFNKIKNYKQHYPYIDFSKEKAYFGN
ncbi:MAG TPA: GSCFA domain-containing protein [Edaphocola sp.]|nr:GSCFA domain-containing protein [Edaphocola sp.]